MNLENLFGEGDELSPWQMSLRAITVFLIALLLIRISGRRSIGMKMPFDNVILFLLGAVLSRGITGASPFLATVCAGFSIVVMHRLFAWLGLYNHTFGSLVKGSSKLLYDKGKFIDAHMKQCTISEKDLLEAVRLNSGLDSLDKIEKAYVERSGEISIIPKKGNG